MKLVISAFAFCLHAGIASAQSFTIYNTTTVIGSDGNAYAAPQNYIGSPYQTLSMTVSQSGSTATMSYITAFDGNDTVNGYNIGYADVFFGGLMSGYAVSMGGQTANGGLAEGVYQVQGAKTSQDIWGGRSGVIFGAGYGANDMPATTVLDSGIFLASMVLTKTQITSGPDAGFYDLSFNLNDLSFNLVQAFENGSVSALWGTGDCANGAFLAVAVPEPASAAMFGVGLGGVCVVLSRRRRRAADLLGSAV